MNRTEFKEVLREATATTNARLEAKGHPMTIQEIWGRLGADMFLSATALLVRRRLRRKGAPEWVAYAGGVIYLSLSQIVTRLSWQERTMLRLLHDGMPWRVTDNNAEVDDLRRKLAAAEETLASDMFSDVRPSSRKMH